MLISKRNEKFTRYGVRYFGLSPNKKPLSTRCKFEKRNNVLNMVYGTKGNKLNK